MTRQAAATMTQLVYLQQENMTPTTIAYMVVLSIAAAAAAAMVTTRNRYRSNPPKSLDEG